MLPRLPGTATRPAARDPLQSQRAGVQSYGRARRLQGA